MRERASTRVARSPFVQSQGTAQVSLGAAEEAPSLRFFPWTTRWAFSWASTRSTSLQPVPLQIGQSDCAMGHRIGAAVKGRKLSSRWKIQEMCKKAAGQDHKPAYHCA